MMRSEKDATWSTEIFRGLQPTPTLEGFITKKVYWSHEITTSAWRGALSRKKE